MKYALCVKLCQHDFTIVIVHKLLVHGHCSESGLHSLPSRSSWCPRSMTSSSEEYHKKSFEYLTMSLISTYFERGVQKYVRNLKPAVYWLFEGRARQGKKLLPDGPNGLSNNSSKIHLWISIFCILFLKPSSRYVIENNIYQMSHMSHIFFWYFSKNKLIVTW